LVRIAFKYLPLPLPALKPNKEQVSVGQSFTSLAVLLHIKQYFLIARKGVILFITTLSS